MNFILKLNNLKFLYKKYINYIFIIIIINFINFINMLITTYIKIKQFSNL